MEEIGAGESRGCWSSTRPTCSTTSARRRSSIRHPDAVLVSALRGEGLDALREGIEAAFDETLTEVELLVPYSEGGAAARAARGGRRAGAH